MGDDLMTAKLGLLGHITMKKPQHAPMTWQHCRPGLNSQISIIKLSRGAQRDGGPIRRRMHWILNKNRTAMGCRFIAKCNFILQNQKPKDITPHSSLALQNQEDRYQIQKSPQNKRVLNVTIDEVCKTLLEGVTGTELVKNGTKYSCKEEESKVKEHKPDGWSHVVLSCM